MDRKYMIFAVDFDGTLFSNCYPEIGEPNQQLIKYLRHRRNHGDKVILWTCRVGPYLQKAIDSCAEYGLEFDAVNTNIPEIVEIFNNESRKVFADVYIDDKAILKPEYQVPFLCADDDQVVDILPTTETETCVFCENLAQIKDIKDYYMIDECVTEYTCALITSDFVNGEQRGTVTYGRMPLRYCPTCGRKLPDLSFWPTKSSAKEEEEKA